MIHNRLPSPFARRDLMDRAVSLIRKLFSGRADTWATFVPGEAYSGKRVDSAVTDGVIRAHLAGERPMGIYPLVKMADGEDGTRWVCIDIDRDDAPDTSHQIAVKIVQHAIIDLSVPVNGYIEITKSKQAHVWVFFDDLVPAWQARGLARLMLSVAGEKEINTKAAGKRKGFETVIIPAHDVCPAKAADGGGGVGVGIWLPWYGAHAADQRQVFYDWQSGAVFADQIEAMESASRLTPEQVQQLVDAHQIEPQNVKRLSAATRPDDPNCQVKAAPGSLPPLTDVEVNSLCDKLSALRAMRDNPSTCDYQSWFAGIMHLVPFANGREIAHNLSALDRGRYDAGVVERQWDNAVKAYTRDDLQPEARVSQRIVEFLRAGGRNDIVPISPMWCIYNGCFARRKLVAMGAEENPVPITNFTAQIVCEEYGDDGTGNRERQVRVKGRMSNGIALPEISVPTKDWTKIKEWLHKGWGFRPVIYVEDRYVLQCLALQGQDAPERTNYKHTGWAQLADGRWQFLMPSGPRGGQVSSTQFSETSRIAVPEKLRVYEVPESATHAEALEAYTWVERLMDCGDLKATAPLVATMFLAPLASFLNIDFALFVTGHTGTHKSSLVAAAMAVWGARWSKDTMPLSFNATANAMELMGFAAKDLPLPIDNYVPDVRGEAARSLKRISHSIGDHAGRDRLNSNAEPVAARPFRSMCIITGEDVPYGAGAGATNRYYIIPMTRSTLKLTDLEAVQEAGWSGKMAPAMSHYLTWLANRMTDPAWITKVQAYQYRLEKEARRLAAGRDHDRLTSQTSWIQTGLELARQSHPNKEWVREGLQLRAYESVQLALMSRRQMSKEASLPYRFLTSLQYLIQCGVIHGVQAETGLAPNSDELASFCGWDLSYQPDRHDPYHNLIHRQSRRALYIHRYGEEWELCFKPEEIVTEIKQSIRMECAIPEGVRGIAQALISEEILDASGADESHITGRIMLWDKTRPRVWRLRGAKCAAILGTTIDGGVPPLKKE